MSKERELLKKILTTRWLDHALSCEVEKLLAQPQKNRLIEVYSDFLKSLISNDGAGLKELKAFDLETYNKLKDIFGVSDLLAQPEQDSFNWDNAPVICELNGYRWLLGGEADKRMNWAKAKAWCQSEGGELPPREILLMAYLNEDIKPLFKTEWYWSSTEVNAQGAWLQGAWEQYFSNSNQNNNLKTNCGYVRVVKKVKI